MSRGRPLTWGALGIVAAVAGLLSVLVWVIATGGGALVPAPPWVALLILLALAGGVLVVARPVRAYLKGTSRKPLDRLRAARVLVLGQAGALTGAAVGGWYLGQLAVLVRDLDLLANRGPALRTGLGVASALLLVGAGMLAQSWCRLPDFGDDESDDNPENGAPAH